MSSIFIFRFGEIRKVQYGFPSGRCLVKISERSTVFVGTDDTTFTVCSMRPHCSFQYKWSTWLVRSSTYVLFIQPQLSWQPNPSVMWHCFVRMASLLLRLVPLCCYENLFPKRMEGPRVSFRGGKLAATEPFVACPWNLVSELFS